jgi:hypothetical protein
MRKIVVATFTTMLLLTLLYTGLACQEAPEPTDTGISRYGAEANPTGNPIGGGEGYTDIIEPGAADFLVSTKSELLNAIDEIASGGTSADIVGELPIRLAGVTPGKTIYVADEAKIDMTGEKNIVIPAGVTLASGRGRDGSPGGLIYTDDLKDASGKVWSTLFKAGDNVRITGLRLRGPDSEIGGDAYEYELYDGIAADGTSGLEVDNCEIFDWSAAGIALYESQTVHVHHNYIHHCHRTGYGYGVAVSGATAAIEANLFDHNRHSIMGTMGYPLSNYEACYNHFLEHTNGHAIDMHGGNDVNDASVPAGGTITIHHNTFQETGHSAVNIRGIPATGASVYANWALYDPDEHSPEWIFLQSLDSLDGHTPYERMEVYDNWYGTGAPPPTQPASQNMMW